MQPIQTVIGGINQALNKGTQQQGFYGDEYHNSRKEMFKINAID